MGKDVHGWVQISDDGEVWLSVVNIGSLLRASDAITMALIDDGGLFSDLGLPDDVDREWERAEFRLDQGFAHTWFDWADFNSVLHSEVTSSETFTYRGDPEFLEDLRVRRMAVRDAFASADMDGREWRLLASMVDPLVARFGAAGVRCIAWFTW